MGGELPAARVTGGDVSGLGRLQRRWLRSLLAQAAVARLVLPAGDQGVHHLPLMAGAMPWLFGVNVASPA